MVAQYGLALKLHDKLKVQRRRADGGQLHRLQNAAQPIEPKVARVERCQPVDDGITQSPCLNVQL